MAHKTPTKLCRTCGVKWTAPTWAEVAPKQCPSCRKRRIFGQRVWSQQLWELRSRITRFRDKGNYQRIWYIRCYNVGCQNDVRFSAGQDKIWTCKTCRHAAMREARPIVRCFDKNCNYTRKVQRAQKTALERKGFASCRNCNGRRLLGIRIQSDDLWSLRKYVVDFTRQGKKRKANMKCIKKGCTLTYVYLARHKGKRQLCRLHCKGLVERAPYAILYNVLLRAVKYSKDKTVGFDFKEFQNICETQKHCVYCKRPVSRSVNSIGRTKVEAGYYLDRLDRKKPYELKNVVTACDTCNLTKSDKLSPQEIAVVAMMRRNCLAEAAKLVRQKTPPKNWPSNIWRIAGHHWDKLRAEYMERCKETRRLKAEAKAYQARGLKQ